jgi:hypothetical protein
MIAPGDEIEEGARSDHVGDPDHEIRQHQECHRIDDVDPEGFMRWIGGNPHHNTA